MFKKIFIFFSIAAFSISVKAQENIKPVYLKDSIFTIEFLKTLSTCEKIDFAEKNIHDIIKSRGFSDLVLISIAKVAKAKLEIRSINGNMVVPDERLILELKEQFNDIKTKKGCKSKELQLTKHCLQAK